MKNRMLVSLLLVGVVLIWGSYLAYRANSNLVTLDVRDMDVREVVKKIAWQTWEIILVDKGVQGKVTFNVKKAPLEAVLNIIDDQLMSRWSAIYPLYSNGKSLTTLKQALRGELDPATHGWTNLQSRSGFRGGGPGGFGGGMFGGEPSSGQNQLVSLHIDNKDVQFATLALVRFAQTRVVPEDGTTAIVNLRFDETSVPKAVSQLAKQAHRSWTKLYTLQGGFGGRGGRGGDGPGDRGRDFAQRDTNNDARPGEGDRRGRDFGNFNFTQEQRDEMRQQRETQDKELMETLPPDERQKLETAQQQREQQRQEMSNLTPEQRQERFAQMGGRGGGGGGGGRQLARIKNTTPEQRVDRYRIMAQRRSRGQGGGSGGGGGRGPGR